MANRVTLLSITLALLTIAAISVGIYAYGGVKPIGQQFKSIGNNGATIYVIGSVPLKELTKLAEGLNVQIVQLKSLRELAMELMVKKGIVIICRRLMPDEKALLRQLLLKQFVIITIGKYVKRQVDNVLSKIATISVTFNGTNVYMYKIISLVPRKGGRYPILIKGYAGSNIDSEVLSDAFKVLSYEESDWKIIGYVNWTSEDKWKPYGKLNIEHAVLYYTPDPWSNMDLYAVKCTTEIIAGAKKGWTDGVDAWWSDYIESHYYLNNYTKIYDLRDYSPSSMDKVPKQITIALTWPPEVYLTWSYPGDYIMKISSEGDLGDNIAGWIHDLGDPSVFAYATKETVRIEPAFEFTVSPEVTGKQRWVISAQWVVPAHRPYPYRPFSGTVVIDFVLYYG